MNSAGPSKNLRFWLLLPFVLSLFFAPEVILAVGHDSQRIIKRIDALHLKTIKDGVMHNYLVPMEDLILRKPVFVEGHVTGVVVFCDGEIDVRVGGKRMNPIKVNSDGTLSIEHFGNSVQDELLSHLNRDHSETDSGTGEGRRASRSIEGYSLFPRIPGDSISAAEAFDLTFEAEGEIFRMGVEHVGYRRFAISEGARSSTGEAMPSDHILFSYIGNRLQTEQMQTQFTDRLLKVQEGIRNVEKVFKRKLVEGVRIIDYAAVKNAFTFEEDRNIWIYAGTFLHDSMEELRTIAEHEALHILVDDMGFHRNPDLNDHFASLKGYGELSMERFLLITRGIAPSIPSDHGGDQSFFAFIDERNFFPGMKGGHSHDNPAEFYTSFLHSLMYVHRLRGNLSAPMAGSRADEPPRWLNGAEQTAILNTYLQTLKIFIDSFDAPKQNPTYEFLERSRDRAKGASLAQGLPEPAPISHTSSSGG